VYVILTYMYLYCFSIILATKKLGKSYKHHDGLIVILANV